jgi:hypothetical protein
MRDDLDQLRVIETRAPRLGKIGIADVAARADDFYGKADGGGRLRVMGGAVAARFDVGIVEPGEILADIAMRRQALIAAVDFGDGERDPFARPGVEAALRQGAVQAEIAFERRRAVGDDAKQVGDHSKLLFDGLE